MSFNLSTIYKNAVIKNTAEVDWLCQLFYDDEGTNDFIGIAGNDISFDGTFYRGIVQSFGNIAESIDLTKSRPKISNITINCVNVFPFADNNLLSEEMWGTRKYFNRKVKIYAWAKGTNLISELPLLFEGRLNNASYNFNIISLNLEPSTPWDKIKIPNILTETTRKYFPIIYGEYQSIDRSVNSFAFTTGSRCWPSIVSERTNNNFVCLNHQTASSKANLYYYEESIKEFTPLKNENTFTIDYQTGNASTGSLNLLRMFSFVPATGSVGAVTLDGTELSGWTGSNFAVDNDSTTEASTSASISIDDLEDLVYATSSIFFDFPALDHFYISMSAKIGTFTTRLDTDSDSDNSRLRLLDDTLVPDLELSSVSTAASGGIQTDSGTSTSNLISSYEGTDPNRIKFKLEIRNEAQTGQVSTAAGNATIDNLFFEMASLISGSGPNTVAFEASKIDILYSAADGFSAGYTDGEGIAKLPHKIFRDMINRFSSFDTTDITVNNITGSDGLNNLNSDRNWNCRYWIIKPVEMSNILAQLQFEGGFIWNQLENSVRVIYVQDTYSSTDHTLNKDKFRESGFSVKHTAITDLVTNYKFNYDRNSAEDTYRSTNEIKNANRSDWRFAAPENIVEKDLDFQYESGSVSSLLSYYDNITGDIKLLVDADLIDVSAHEVQIGDTVRFDNNNMPYAPFGQTWTNKVFMVIKSRRTPTSNKITAREVGSLT